LVQAFVFDDGNHVVAVIFVNGPVTLCPGEGIVVGEILDSLLTRLLPLVVLDDDEGVLDQIAGERDVSNITGGIGIVPEGIESGHGQVESLGCYKKLDVRVVRVSNTAKKGRVNWNSGKVHETDERRNWQLG
jgi:hypothetical protein